MTIALEDLHGCFEGVIPSIIATASAEGTPNISYLSHVARVDETHIALSNQFFAKTAANIRANPRATLLLVDGNDGSQYALDIEFERSIETGPLFEHIALQLRASSAQVGMADVMRLRSADLFLVHSIRAVASPVTKDKTPSRPRPLNLAAVARISSALEAQADAGGIIDALLSGLSRDLGYGNVLSC
jgi:adenylate cyclase